MCVREKRSVSVCGREEEHQCVCERRGASACVREKRSAVCVRQCVCERRGASVCMRDQQLEQRRRRLAAAASACLPASQRLVASRHMMVPVADVAVVSDDGCKVVEAQLEVREASEAVALQRIT